MLDFEACSRRHGMPDPDIYLEHSYPRREWLRKWIADLMLYNIDAHVQRRKEIEELELLPRAQDEDDEDDEYEDSSSNGSEEEEEEEDESESSREEGRKEGKNAGDSSEQN